MELIIFWPLFSGLAISSLFKDIHCLFDGIFKVSTGGCIIADEVTFSGLALFVIAVFIWIVLTGICLTALIKLFKNIKIKKEELNRKKLYIAVVIYLVVGVIFFVNVEFVSNSESYFSKPETIINSIILLSLLSFSYLAWKYIKKQQ